MRANRDRDSPRYRCNRCDHSWVGRTDRRPTFCPECRSLMEVRLGDNLRSVGDHAFRDCSFLKKAYFEGEMPVMGNSVFYGTADGFTVVYESEHSDSWEDYDETRKESDGGSGIVTFRSSCA